MPGKGLNPEQNERVRALVRELLRKHEGNQSELAPKLGVRQPMLSGFLSGRSGTSYLFASKVAELLDMSVHDVLGGKKPQKQAANASERREAAAELARDDGVSETAIRSVLEEPIRGHDAERSVLWWALKMRVREVEIGSSSTRPRGKGGHDP